MNNTIKFIIAPNDEILIGVPNDLDWRKSVIQLDSKHIHILNKDNQVAFEAQDGNSVSQLISLLRNKKKAFLCYIKDDIPCFEIAEI